jgi:hypothetical protein
MAQSIAEIKKGMTGSFMRSAQAQAAWGFSGTDDFGRLFSSASVEDILFSNTAVAMNDLSQLMDALVAEITQMVAGQKAHTPRWYQQKALQFMANKLLVPETDYYDTSGMTEAQIADAKIVRYCAAVSAPDSSELTLKIAGETAGEKGPISAPQLGLFEAYLAEVKDAGVRLRVVNSVPERLYFTIDIWYDALLLPADVEAGVRSAAQNYINNLPFNGEYTNMSLVDAVQSVPGVKVAELLVAGSLGDGGEYIQDIAARYSPASGYFNLGDVVVNMIPYGL